MKTEKPDAKHRTGRPRRSKYHKVSVTLPNSLYDLTTRLAKAEKTNCSRLVEECLRSYLYKGENGYRALGLSIMLRQIEEIVEEAVKMLVVKKPPIIENDGRKSQ